MLTINLLPPPDRETESNKDCQSVLNRTIDASLKNLADPNIRKKANQVLESSGIDASDAGFLFTNQELRQFSQAVNLLASCEQRIREKFNITSNHQQRIILLLLCCRKDSGLNISLRDSILQFLIDLLYPGSAIDSDAQSFEEYKKREKINFYWGVLSLHCAYDDGKDVLTLDIAVPIAYCTHNEWLQAERGLGHVLKAGPTKPLGNIHISIDIERPEVDTPNIFIKAFSLHLNYKDNLPRALAFLQRYYSKFPTTCIGESSAIVEFAASLTGKNTEYSLLLNLQPEPLWESIEKHQQWKKTKEELRQLLLKMDDSFAQERLSDCEGNIVQHIIWGKIHLLPTEFEGYIISTCFREELNLYSQLIGRSCFSPTVSGESQASLLRLMRQEVRLETFSSADENAIHLLYLQNTQKDFNELLNILQTIMEEWQYVDTVLEPSWKKAVALFVSEILKNFSTACFEIANNLDINSLQNEQVLEKLRQNLAVTQLKIYLSLLKSTTDEKDSDRQIVLLDKINAISHLVSSFQEFLRAFTGHISVLLNFPRPQCATVIEPLLKALNAVVLNDADDLKALQERLVVVWIQSLLDLFKETESSAELNEWLTSIWFLDSSNNMNFFVDSNTVGPRIKDCYDEFKKINEIEKCISDKSLLLKEIWKPYKEAIFKAISQYVLAGISHEEVKKAVKEAEYHFLSTILQNDRAYSSDKVKSLLKEVYQADLTSEDRTSEEIKEFVKDKITLVLNNEEEAEEKRKKWQKEVNALERARLIATVDALFDKRDVSLAAEEIQQEKADFYARISAETQITYEQLMEELTNPEESFFSKDFINKFRAYLFNRELNDKQPETAFEKLVFYVVNPLWRSLKVIPEGITLAFSLGMYRLARRCEDFGFSIPARIFDGLHALLYIPFFITRATFSPTQHQAEMEKHSFAWKAASWGTSFGTWTVIAASTFGVGLAVGGAFLGMPLVGSSAGASFSAGAATGMLRRTVIGVGLVSLITLAAKGWKRLCSWGTKKSSVSEASPSVEEESADSVRSYSEGKASESSHRSRSSEPLQRRAQHSLSSASSDLGSGREYNEGNVSAKNPYFLLSENKSQGKIGPPQGAAPTGSCVEALKRMIP